MTIKIRKSLLADPHAFDVDVAAHAHELRHWREHMQRVEGDKKNPNLDPIDRHMPYPEPVPHPLIASVFNDVGDPDYELVDDSPEEVLALKKAALSEKIVAAEREVIDEVIPPGKQRAFVTRMHDINAKAAVAREKRSLLKKMFGKEEEPAPEDAAFLAEYAEKMDRIQAAHKVVAQALHDIDELSIENVDSYQLPTL